MKIKIITHGDPNGLHEHSYVNVDEQGVEFAQRLKSRTYTGNPPLRKRRIEFITWDVFDAIIEARERVRG